jgi:hypothetical protein
MLAHVFARYQLPAHLARVRLSAVFTVKDLSVPRHLHLVIAFNVFSQLKNEFVAVRALDSLLLFGLGHCC